MTHTAPSDRLGLDQEEVSAQPPPPQTFTAWLDRSTGPEPRRIAYETLARVLGDSDPRPQRTLLCRTRATFVRHRQTAQVRIHTNACRSRWCPYCARARASRIAANAARFTTAAVHPTLLTLTLRLSTDSIRVVANRIIDSFKFLRRDQLWTTRVKGGVWFLQIVPKPEKASWHVHLHILMDSQFIIKNTLSILWSLITGDSPILDIRRVRGPDHAARYVSRYVSRPVDLAALTDAERDEVVGSLAGLHLVGCFGNAAGRGILAKLPFDKTEWDDIGSWSTVAGLYNVSPVARAIWHAYRTRTPLPPDITLRDVDRELDGWTPLPPKPPPERTLPWDCTFQTTGSAT